MTKLIQDLNKFNGDKIYLTLDQIEELHNNIKSSIDFTSITLITKADGHFGIVKSIPIYLKN